MFTGIIKHTGIFKKNSFGALSIYSPTLSPNKGDSISVNGVCLTVVTKKNHTIEFDVMPETLRCTTFQFLKDGDKVNLETALKLNDFLGGHLVTGHVDSTCEVKKIKKDKNSKIVIFSFPKELAKFIANKGSIAVNGVSLTVINASSSVFEVSLVEYTLKHTNLGNLHVSDKVNLEVDIIARYLENLNKHL